MSEPRRPSSVDRERSELRELRADPERRYQREDEIARGGMGAILKVVDRALDRSLAMKVMLHPEPASAGSQDDEPRLHRFLEEARVTAQLDHPGIVPVHELGVDDAGEMYFTMKLVKGRELTRIFRLHHDGDGEWPLPRCLSLLLRAAEAVSFAHDRGVVHRDLKPDNVMVGRYGEVYVMDWGLARVLSRDDAEEEVEAARPRTVVRGVRDDGSSPRTQEGSALGTVYYMPPEQAAGRLREIGPHSDVYAMGAILYELLSGHRPYHSAADPMIAIGLILNGPPRPIDAPVPQELIAICDRAMAREPADRYPSMGAFAEDLRAFLEGRTVQAHRTGAVAEFRKWIQRNRALASSLAAGLLLLLGGLAAVALVKHRANEQLASANADLQIAQEDLEGKNNALQRQGEELSEQETRAREAAEEARQQAAIARAVNDFLNRDLLAAAMPSSAEGRGRDAPMSEVLQVAARRLQAATRPGGRFAEQARVEAGIRETLGAAFHELGLMDQALVQLERAAELHRREHGAGTLEILSLRRMIGGVLAALSRFDEAEAEAREAVRGFEALRGADDPETLHSRKELATVLQTAGKLEEADELYRDVLARSRSLPEAERSELWIETLCNDAASLASAEGRLDDAEALFEESLEVARRGHREDEVGAMVTASNLASLLLQKGQNEQALTRLEELSERCREVLGPAHPNSLTTLVRLGQARWASGDEEGAESSYRQALARGEESGRELDLSDARNDLGSLLCRQGHKEEGLPMIRRAREEAIRWAGPAAANTVTCTVNLSAVLVEEGQAEEALEIVEQTLDAVRDFHGDESDPALELRSRKAQLLFIDGFEAEAIELVEELLESIPEDHPRHASFERLRGMLILSRSRDDDRTPRDA